MVDLKNNFNIKKIDYIYNLFDIDTIKELSKNNIGRLDNGKNHRLIIEAMKNLEADGEELNLNNKVYLLGKKENPFAFLSKADCLHPIMKDFQMC